MNNIINVKPNTDEWLELRKTGIGGSDAPAILGVSNYATPFDVYQSKLGLSEPQPVTFQQKFGHVNEALILDDFAEKHGITLNQRGVLIRSNSHDFMMATLDAITDDGVVVEAKTSARGFDFGEDGTDQIPESYLIQVHHQMMVVNAKKAHIPVLLFGNERRDYVVDFHEGLANHILEAEKQFWQNVQTQTPPEPKSPDEALAIYRKANNAPIEANAEMFALYNELKDIRKKAAECEAIEKIAKTRIMNYMGECDTLTYQGQKLITWNARKSSEGFDKIALKAAHPDIYNQFVKIGKPTRTFLIK